MRKNQEDSIKYVLSHAPEIRRIDNNRTRKAYLRQCGYYAEWLRSKGINKPSKLASYGEIKAMQEYADYLRIERQLPPTTVKTYLAGPCKAYGISRTQLEGLEKRTSDKLRKTRDKTINRQGQREVNQAKHARLVDFQRAVGLRRSELSRLTEASLVRDESGYLCVAVHNGKGGKDQLQRILTKDEDLVRAVFAGVEAQKHVFSRSEMSNNISLHSLRAEHARDCYRYYADRLASEPDYCNQLREELLKRYNAMHINGDSHRDAIGRNHYIQEMTMGNGIYRCRGVNRKRMIEAGMDPDMNRMALLAVSVFHLSHWRCDVTVINYMC